MSENNIAAAIARIDERTKNIQSDVSDLKKHCEQLNNVVVEHGNQIAVLTSRVNNGAGLTGKQKAGFGAGLAAFIAAIVWGLTEFFTRH